jgi:Porin PorA
MVGLGFFLVFLSPFLKFYAVPRVEKAPLDLYDKTVSRGYGRYFDVQTLSVVGPRPLINISIHKGDVEAGTDNVAVYDAFENTKDAQTGQFIDIGDKDRIVFDRSTGLAVRCCGATPHQEGHTLKFPFETKRQTYPFWDSTAELAFPAEYIRDETLEGLRVHVFRQVIKPVVIGQQDIPGSLAGVPDQATVTANRWYKSVTTLWVEPRTGGIVKGVQQSTQWLASAGTNDFFFTVADVNLGNDQESVARVADRIKSQAGQLTLVKYWIPIFALVLGVPLVIVGLVLLARAPREDYGTTFDQRIESAPAASP